MCVCGGAGYRRRPEAGHVKHLAQRQWSSQGISQKSSVFQTEHTRVPQTHVAAGGNDSSQTTLGVNYTSQTWRQASWVCVCVLDECVCVHVCVN